MAMQPSDLLWIDHHGVHPAVVINVYKDGTLLVVCGTGTDWPHDPTRIRVDWREPASKAWGLTKLTYFYDKKIAVVSTAAITRTVGKKCPPSLFHKLEALVQAASTPIIKPVAAPIIAPEAIAAYAPEPPATAPSSPSTLHHAGTETPATKPIK